MGYSDDELEIAVYGLKRVGMSFAPGKTISVIISSIELGLFFIAKTCTKLQLLILIVLVTESLYLLIQTCINIVQKKHNDDQQKLLKGAS